LSDPNPDYGLEAVQSSESVTHSMGCTASTLTPWVARAEERDRRLAEWATQNV
jgi:hypothetical protein